MKIKTIEWDCGCKVELPNDLTTDCRLVHCPLHSAGVRLVRAIQDVISVALASAEPKPEATEANKT